jgi:adenylate cyclase class 2
MPVDIEAKIKVDSLDTVRDRLKELNAAFAGEALETNVFFDTEDRSLLAGDRGLRLRTAESKTSGQKTNTITYKGPRLHGPLKSRDERELGVTDPDDAAALFESLGYQKILSFQKRRESWRLNGCKIELDELPHLGVFVEIEGASETAVMKTRDALRLADRPLIKSSYIALLMTFLQEHHRKERIVRFEDR